MESGCIHLYQLLKLAQDDREGCSMSLNTTEGRCLGKKMASLCEAIPKNPGFYAWGKYESNGLWRTIYVGRAGRGKTTSLNYRILNELKVERSFFWLSPFDELREKNVQEIWHRYYPANSSDAVNHFKRSIRKVGSTHIIWVSTPNMKNEDIIKVEPDLIETTNPVANSQRPAPLSELQQETIEVLKLLKREIHKHRPEK